MDVFRAQDRAQQKNESFTCGVTPQVPYPALMEGRKKGRKEGGKEEGR